MPRPKSARIERVCQQCGQTFLVPPWRKDTAAYCSLPCRDAAKTVPLAVKFARLCGEPTSTGCVPWLGTKSKGGYGMIGHPPTTAHRVAYALAHGPIPDGTDVCHSCDNPGCVALAHLFLGTRADNMADAKAKGRHHHGETHSHAKLTEADVREIRDGFDQGRLSCKDIMTRFHLTGSYVYQIIRRKTWKHI